MGYAIKLFFDHETEMRICSLWEDLAKVGVPSMQNGSRPHVSLVVAESVDQSATRRFLDDFALITAPFPLSLESLGLFPSEKSIAYLAPIVTTELLALHRRFFEQFSTIASDIWQHYVPGAWVPHCTLAMGLAPHQMGQAFDACQAFGLPRSCTLIEIGLVEFRPVKQLYSAPLVAK